MISTSSIIGVGSISGPTAGRAGAPPPLAERARHHRWPSGRATTAGRAGASAASTRVETTHPSASANATTAGRAGASEASTRVETTHPSASANATTAGRAGASAASPRVETTLRRSKRDLDRLDQRGTARSAGPTAGRAGATPPLVERARHHRWSSGRERSEHPSRDHPPPTPTRRRQQHNDFRTIH